MECKALQTAHKDGSFLSTFVRTRFAPQAHSRRRVDPLACRGESLEQDNAAFFRRALSVVRRAWPDLGEHLVRPRFTTEGVMLQAQPESTPESKWEAGFHCTPQPFADTLLVENEHPAGILGRECSVP